MRKVRITIFIPEFLWHLYVDILLFYMRLRYGFPSRIIPLTRGRFAIVDEADFEKLSEYKWFAVKSGRSFYAHRMIKSNDVRRRQILVHMHRQILNAKDGEFVDHINHNGLDNRRANLRLVNKEQNTWNKRKQLGRYSSKYKGVSWHKPMKHWQARIRYKGKPMRIGYFDDQKSAARAYDAKAKELFGEYAALNFPDFYPERV